MIAVGEVPTARLPAEYQEVEYVTILNDATHGYKNKISLKNDKVPISVLFYYIDEIELKASIPAQRSNTMLFCGYTDSAAGASPFLYVNRAGILNDSGGDMDFTSTTVATFDGNPFVLLIQNIMPTSKSAYITFGAWADSGYSATMNWYYVKMSKDGVAVVDLVPCYRKSDNAVGFYDLVGGKFIPPHPASNQSAFVAGGAV